MTDANPTAFDPAPGTRSVFANAPEGLDALALARMAADEASTSKTWLHVARDDARMTRLAEHLAFFDSELQVLTFPAWDCLPYDRVSPHRDILAQRIDTLTLLLADPQPAKPRVVITTVNALLQRVPPKDAFESRTLTLACGASVAQTVVTDFLAGNGYTRSDSVAEPGEYAIRGGLIDLFPPGTEHPLRLDFFGDELESIRAFDPLSQISVGTRDSLILKPVNEVVLDAACIQRFRTGYRELFGLAKDDPLYGAVSEARPHPGMEHWLPLFFERLETLFDYLPGAPVTTDDRVEEARDARIESIEDFYDARRAMEGAQEVGGWAYHPLETKELYVTKAEWEQTVGARPGGRFFPFAVPEDSEAIDDLGGSAGLDFAAARTDPQGNVFDAVGQAIATQQKKGRRVFICAGSTGAQERLTTLLQEHGVQSGVPAPDWQAAIVLSDQDIGLFTLDLDRGFKTRELIVLTEQDILGERLGRPQKKRVRAENFLTEVSSLHENDLVVHVDHGIGRYERLETLEVGGAPHDCLRIIYHGGDKLFVPVENIEVLTRFGSEDADVELDRLGGAHWQSRKARIKERLKDIADNLIKTAAAREIKAADRLTAGEGLYHEFAARFPYAETEDQDRAIDDTLNDLGSGRPMDRLICGDVGFGKTEVALRAAFSSVMSGKQVAIVVPTTLLARQHFRTFIERFTGLPVEVRQLSRLTPPAEANLTKAGLTDGSVDIVVGTHTLLGKSIEFKDLGLLIVDEEQHFGVKQKERLKELKEDVHVLTLTATPIPRTLQMAMSGVKEMSIIASPPVDRLAVRTFVLPYDPVIVREAIMREHYRGGQVFYVCPRIKDLPEVEERLKKLVPEIKIGVAHGQLSPAALEAVMTGFYERKYDVLLSTNIVESGLDIPNANTLVIHRADNFGLAQLYQLRGRIGRSKIRGYAYLTLPPGRILTTAAEKRLHVMQTLDTLGAGFQLASHDLDIRGAGNLLGEEQSGQVREVGIELYQQMLEEAVANARGKTEEVKTESFSPQINLGTSVLIPESYVADLSVRLGLYRRLSSLIGQNEIEAFAAELIDRFGTLPEEVENLLQIMTIKRLCVDAGVEKLDAGPKGAIVTFHANQFTNPEGLIRFIQKQPGQVSLRPDHKLVYRRSWPTPAERLRGSRHLLDSLAKLVKGDGAAAEKGAA